MKIDYLDKTRDEQEEEIKTYFKPYADENCKICFGTGKRGWHTDLRQYIICECVLMNIEAEKQRMENLIHRPDEGEIELFS